MVKQIIQFIGSIFNLYRIVPVNEAHIRIMFEKREAFMSRTKSNTNTKYNSELKEDNLDRYKPAYWFIPYVTKISKLPLDNIRIDVDEVKLNDKNMAKFMCDVIVFVNIDNPLLCAERTTLTIESINYEGHIPNIAKDFQTIIESHMRSVATQFDLLEIYKDRTKLDNAITTQIQEIFLKWGLRLVNLEIKDIKDAKDSSIILDIERKQSAVINADARVKIAEETKRAVISEAENQKESELKKAITEEEWKKRHIEKEQVLSIAEQEKLKNEALKMIEANRENIKAKKELEVGQAEINKQIIEKNSEAEKLKLTLTAEGLAKQIEIQGFAEADVIKAKLFAEADGKNKLQESLNKFSDNAIRTLVAEKIVDTQKEIGVASAKSLENADIRVFVGSDNGNGFDIGKAVSSINVSNESTANSILNKLARPNDLGFANLDLNKQIKEAKDKIKK